VGGASIWPPLRLQHLQAAIAAVHAEAESVAATDWRQIVALYDQLVRIQPSPVVQLNRAVAIAMRDGPEAGLAHIDAVLEHGDWQITTWRIPPVQICGAGSAGQLRLGPLTRRRWH
jgi:hypothetical protein